ncbi:amylo-alpha-1,6-glucosidase [Paenibacillus sp. FSL K6-3166]|uniref:amylo-alpha-1,6-glucosidase n=1 Tax=unclassified Paenibacillus TaxID=185978 RepID=UPI000BA04184|nr:amylo-alpha-1,6-glucosidase [Paenibacillus sp. VTT E-133291]OZQ90262.1 amylo-alpha-1,6-glucosidase [Paenibacillus sp. VTT E-133291]
MNYRVIKENDLFLMTDKSGDIPDNDQSGLGLYTRDTRFLSRMEIRINNQRPILLSSAADENYISTIRLTNPHMEEDGKLILWRESVEIERTRFIYEGALYETFKLTSYYPKAIQFDFSVLLDADFTDMFVIRGFQHGKLGSKTGERSAPGERVISYLGADELLRETKVKWDTQESRISETGEVHFDVELKHQESVEIAFFIAPMINGNEPLQHEPKEAMNRLRASYASWNASSTSISSDMPLFNKLYHRGVQDLRVLLTDLGYGQFPVAGLPWYSVPFGRDSLIAALQMLSSNPQIAKGTLLTMAAYQGQKEDEWRDEQPGKVMHEIRYGELAATNQVPFTPYYGTIDATPLFLLLTAEYYHWTGDLDFVSSLMPHLNAALNWIKEYGDYDKDSFVEYYQKSSKGIANQGWKDSADSVIHSNGDYAEAPIALVEVQGYVYQALTRLAPIFKSLGHEEQAEVMEKDAAQLRTRFEEDFWMNDEQFYAIALDKDKKRVDSVTSNAGHILMSGIASPERAKAVAARLVAPDLFGGYGIRTMSTAATGYNPMSYHDGSVWPHDNSLCLLGLSQSGFTEEAITVMQGLLNAADQFEYYRLPELYCGYSDQLGAPVPYPVACSPQAWAAGTPLTFVQALLGLQPNALTRQITIKPALLNGMNDLKVEQLQIGNGTLSLRVSRVDNEPKLEILSNQTGYELVIL